jgi:hypothetical protein
VGERVPQRDDVERQRVPVDRRCARVLFCLRLFFPLFPSCPRDGRMGTFSRSTQENVRICLLNYIMLL